MAGQVFAIASGKGGVGKTTTVVNLGVVLRRADHSVVLVDADLGMANLGPMLGVSGELTLHDVLAGESTVEDALVEEAPGFAVLPGSDSLTDYPEADPQHLGAVLEILAESYEFVLVDTGAGMSHEDVLPLGLADRVVLVASPDPAAIGDTRKTAELAGLAEGDIAGLVVTKADADTDATHVASQVGVDLLGVIPYDPTVRESTASGRPLEAIDPDTPAATAYRELANVLADGATGPLTGPQAPDVEGMDVPAEPATTDDPLPDDNAGTDAGEPPEAGSSADSEESEDGGVAETTEAAEAAADEEPSAAETESPTAAPEDEPPAESDDATPETTSDEAEPASDADDEAEADDEESDMAGDDEAEPEDEAAVEATEDEAAEPATDEAQEVEEEDYLAEFEDDEPESKGGILSRIGRLFR